MKLADLSTEHLKILNLWISLNKIRTVKIKYTQCLFLLLIINSIQCTNAGWRVDTFPPSEKEQDRFKKTGKPLFDLSVMVLPLLGSPLSRQSHSGTVVFRQVDEVQFFAGFVQSLKDSNLFINVVSVPVLTNRAKAGLPIKEKKIKRKERKSIKEQRQFPLPEITLTIKMEEHHLLEIANAVEIAGPAYKVIIEYSMEIGVLGNIYYLWVYRNSYTVAKRDFTLRKVRKKLSELLITTLIADIEKNRMPLLEKAFQTK